MATLKSVILAFLVILVGALITGFLAGPSSDGLVVLGGMLVSGAVAITIAGRLKGASASKTTAWTVGSIVALYAYLLLPEWWATGRVYWGSVLAASSVVVGLFIGWLWVVRTKAQEKRKRS